jgi:hypothetical protein
MVCPKDGSFENDPTHLLDGEDKKKNDSAYSCNRADTTLLGSELMNLSTPTTGR